MPSLIEMRGGASVQAGQHPVTESAHTVTAGGLHHGLVLWNLTLGFDRPAPEAFIRTLKPLRKR